MIPYSFQNTTNMHNTQLLLLELRTQIVALTKNLKMHDCSIKIIRVLVQPCVTLYKILVLTNYPKTWPNNSLAFPKLLTILSKHSKYSINTILHKPKLVTKTQAYNQQTLSPNKEKILSIYFI